MYSDEQIRQIILDMGSESKKVLLNALGIIRYTEDEQFLTHALEMLETDNPEIINAALITLRYLDKFHSTDFLQQLLPFFNYPSHCANAIGILSKLKISDTSRFPKLYRFIEDIDENVRYEALHAIERLKYPKNERLEIALHLLHDSSAKIRAKACDILAYLHNPIAVEALIAKLDDHEIGTDGYMKLTVSMEAIKALQYIRDARAIEPLKNVVRYAPERVAIHALDTLGWFSTDLTDFNCELLKHNHEEIQIFAVHNLRRIANVKAISALSNSLYTDASKIVQEEIITAFHEIGSYETLKAVKSWKTRMAKS